MKVYTIQNGTVTIGATVTTHTLSSGAKIPVLSVGEAGRGRKLAYLVVDLLPTSQKQWAETGKVDIQFAKTGQTKAGAIKLIQTAADSNPDEVLAVFRTHIGFRGSNSHRGDYDGQPFECEHPIQKAANCLAFPGVVLAEGTILKDCELYGTNLESFINSQLGKLLNLMGYTHLDVIVDTNVSPWLTVWKLWGVSEQIGQVVRTGYGGRLYGAPSHHFY